MAGEQVQHDGQVIPAFLCPQIRHLAAPDLILDTHLELPIQYVGNINTL